MKSTSTNNNVGITNLQLPGEPLLRFHYVQENLAIVLSALSDAGFTPFVLNIAGQWVQNLYHIAALLLESGPLAFDRRSGAFLWMNSVGSYQQVNDKELCCYLQDLLSAHGRYHTKFCPPLVASPEEMLLVLKQITTSRPLRSPQQRRTA